MKPIRFLLPFWLLAFAGTGCAHRRPQPDFEAQLAEVKELTDLANALMWAKKHDPALRKKLELVSSPLIKAKDEFPERPRLLREAAKLLSEVRKAQNRSADQDILPK